MLLDVRVAGGGGQVRGRVALHAPRRKAAGCRGPSGSRLPSLLGRWVRPVGLVVGGSVSVAVCARVPRAAGVVGRSRNQSPSTHTHTAHPSQEWRAASGVGTRTHTHPNTRARRGGAQPKPEPKHTHPHRTPLFFQKLCKPQPSERSQQKKRKNKEKDPQPEKIKRRSVFSNLRNLRKNFTPLFGGFAKFRTLTEKKNNRVATVKKLSVACPKHLANCVP